jgi:hypothetical protein
MKMIVVMKEDRLQVVVIQYVVGFLRTRLIYARLDIIVFLSYNLKMVNFLIKSLASRPVEKNTKWLGLTTESAAIGRMSAAAADISRLINRLCAETYI